MLPTLAVQMSANGVRPGGLTYGPVPMKLTGHRPAAVRGPSRRLSLRSACRTCSSDSAATKASDRREHLGSGLLPEKSWSRKTAARRNNLPSGASNGVSYRPRLGSCPRRTELAEPHREAETCKPQRAVPPRRESPHLARRKKSTLFGNHRTMRSGVFILSSFSECSRPHHRFHQFPSHGAKRGPEESVRLV